MTLSSCKRADRRVRLLGAVVAGEGAENVHASAGQACGGLDGAFAFGAFTLVVGARVRLIASHDQRQRVHHPAQAPALALQGVDASGALIGIPVSRRQVSPDGELVDRANQCGVTDRSEEFSPEPESRSQQAGDYLGQGMSAKSGLDCSTGGLDAAIEVEHFLRRLGCQLDNDVFTREPHRLRLRCDDCREGDRFRVAHPCGQNHGQPGDASTTDRLGTLGRQHHRPNSVSQANFTQLKRCQRNIPSCPQAVNRSKDLSFGNWSVKT